MSNNENSLNLDKVDSTQTSLPAPKEVTILEKQTVVEITPVENFDKMGLKDNLLRGIYSYGFDKPSLIQSKAIVPIISKKEIIVQSQSGTGKTGTFSISALQCLNETINKCQIIVMSPTHELAKQTKNVMENIGRYLNIKIALCIGGLSIQENKKELDSAHVVIGTPGRTYHMIKDGYLNTMYVNMLILDEADEMLSGDFKDQIRNIIRAIPTKTQICLFSATMPDYVLSLTKAFMNNPVEILIKKEELTLDGIKQFYLGMEREEWKFDALKDLYTYLTISQSIIYVNTKNKAEWLQKRLKEDAFSASVIHSEMSPSDRSDVLQDFRKGGTRVLISTDLLSRGIDIQQVSIVINFDLPTNYECYIHRIGRSGRFGRKGVAINFITTRDERRLQDIERYYKIKIEPMPDPNNFGTITEFMQ